VLRGLRGRNLQGIDLEIPLGRLTVVTGVSGSGKSTAVHATLYRALAQLKHGARRDPAPFDGIEGDEHVHGVVLVDQSPIGRSPRSTPATSRAPMRYGARRAARSEARPAPSPPRSAGSGCSAAATPARSRSTNNSRSPRRSARARSS